MEIVDQKSRIEKIGDTGYEFHFEQYLSQGWDLFRKAPMQLVLYTLIVLGVSIVIGLIPIVGTIGGVIVGPVLMAGYYIGIKKLDETNAVEIGDFFKSFDYWLQLFLYELVSGLLVGLAFLLLVLPGIWLVVALSFGSAFIVFAKFEFWDSIKTSAEIVNKKWFSFFGLIIVLGFINLVGALFLGLGLFITIPFTYGVIYSCYKDIVGFGATQERDVIDHLVDDKF
ncbi:hypothetical protein G3O08_07750 [Cryomorpha ignava]|uniref:DUF975 family protein n=1 Tax=Cryomorpha ignava TaxID=101383 RepID=A0A7K3WQT2_9FLAO|nr:hypothetical protein [Cryomorpha ignava]NEN23391.1 hypothetical protein [Cryomorpha ignava]